MTRIAFITLGCAKNEVDTDKMRARVIGAGYELVEDPADADAVILNTCSFITEATEEAISTILEVLDVPRVAAGDAKLVVTGCLPARYGSELEGELPEVAAFLGVADEDNIVAHLERLVGSPAGKAAPGTSSLAGTDAPGQGAQVAGSETADPQTACAGRTVTKPWAYVKIADGCDRRCSFCTIPQIRGPYRSYPLAEISAEVQELVSGGVREIILIAQDTGIWKPSLPQLLTTLAERFSSTWFRVMYLQPQGVTDALLAVMAEHPNICAYLDIPLQHANKRILREMNRAGDGESYLALLARIRKALPDVALRTTIIAGFPSETRAEARELERFIEAARFDYVGVFPYSREEGTPAGKRVDQVPARTRRARAQRLRDLADAIGFEKAAERVGKREEVLVIEADTDTDVDVGMDADTDIGELDALEPAGSYPLLGRSAWQAPEVDGVVHLNGGVPGEVVCARIVAAYCYELDGEITEAHE